MVEEKKVQVTKAPTPVARKVPTRAEFVKQSKLSKLKSWHQTRSPELVAIDDRLEQWEQMKDPSDFTNRLGVLNSILAAIDKWKQEGRNNALPAVEKLERDVKAEKNSMGQAKTQRSTNIVPTGTYAETDGDAVKATKIFKAFMRWVQGSGVRYKTTGTGDILGGAKIAFCGMYANALVD